MFDPGNGSLRTDRWRYIRYSDGSEELYDLTNDPNEWDNLANNAKYAGEKKSLKKMLSPFLVKTESK
jgi:hypothetical protein